MQLARFKLFLLTAFFVLSAAFCALGQVEVAYGDHQRQKLDYYRANNRYAPILVFVHGGSWKGGDKRASKSVKIAELFQSKGYAVVSINYRLSSDTDYGGFQDVISDLHCAMGWVNQNANTIKGDADRVVVFGNSAGAHLAVLYGLIVGTGGYDCTSEEQLVPEVVIATSGMYLFDTAGTNLQVKPWVFSAFDDMLVDSATYWRKAQPVYHTATSPKAFYLLAGTGDTLADPMHSRWMHDSLTVNGHCSRLKFFEGANHGLANDVREEKEPYVTILAHLDSVWNGMVCGAVVPPGTELPESEVARAMPNPAHDIVNVVFKEEVTRVEEIVLWDFQGNQVADWPGIDLIENQYRIILNVAEINRGLYLLKIRTDKGETTEKMFLR